MSLLAHPHSARATKEHPLLTRAGNLRAILDSVQANVFVADLDHNMVYANPSALAALHSIHGSVKDSFGVDSGDMVGGQIHRFHRDPERIKRLLGDGKNFPRSASFSFGETTLHTDINAIRDESGGIIGYCVAWSDASWDESVGEVARETSSRILELGERLEGLGASLTQQAGQTSQSASTAAAAVEQMSAAVHEIAGSTTRAVAVAHDAVGAAQDASTTVDKLDAS
ncbi:PAS domain-containing protein, partial [Demequina zhanjiangensis]